MYDVAILGAGPAGIAAAIYASRYNLKTIVLAQSVGGWVKKANIIENFPSQLAIAGKELAGLFEKQLLSLSLEFKKSMVKAIEKENSTFKIETNKGIYESKYIVYALGTRKRKLNVPGESKFIGKGVCFCATCDAPFFKDRVAVVVGGNDSGATTALLVSDYAKKVYLIEIMEKLPCEPFWLEKIKEKGNIEIITSETIKEIKGSNVVESVKLGSGLELSCDGIFIEIGQIVNTEIAKEAGAELDKFGCVVVDNKQESSIKSLFAAGDLTSASNYLRQIVTAQAEGAIAANSIYKRELKRGAKEQ